MRKVATLGGIGLLVCFGLSVAMHATTAASLLALEKVRKDSSEHANGDGDGTEVELLDEGDQSSAPGAKGEESGKKEEEDLIGKLLEGKEKPPPVVVVPVEPVQPELQAAKEKEKPPAPEKEREALPPLPTPGAEQAENTNEEGRSSPGTENGTALLPSVPNEDGLGTASRRSSGDGINGLDAQRSRLGDAKACEDPVAGTWQAKVYDAERAQWYTFTLGIRNEGGTLTGSIQSKFWNGASTVGTAPTSCKGSGLYAVVAMPGRGNFDGKRMRFGARTWSLEHLYCGPSLLISYSPDRFRGTVDGTRNEMQAMVSDDTNWLDQPMLF